MEDKHASGSNRGLRVVRNDKHAERDTTRPGLDEMRRTYEKRVEMNKAGHVNDVTRGQ